MIVVRRKPLEDILSFIAPYRKVLLLGCGSCAAVCFAGGEKETEEIACLLPVLAREKQMDVEVRAATCQRVCDWEFVEPVLAGDDKPDAIVSFACGAGTNLLADRVGALRVFPGTDTLFIGATTEHGAWKEMCGACGDCVLDRTFGICPVARCSKSILNGPCGGSKNGKCEINPETDCAWMKIVERAAALGRLDDLGKYIPPKNWATSHHGGPRRVTREDLKIVKPQR
jgi:ferredoxin